MLALIRFSMRTLFPAHAGMPGVEQCDLRGFLDRFWREAAPMMKLGLVLSTILYNLSPLFTVYIPLPLVLLPRGLRDKHADRAATSGCGRAGAPMCAAITLLEARERSQTSHEWKTRRRRGQRPRIDTLVWPNLRSRRVGGM